MSKIKSLKSENNKKNNYGPMDITRHQFYTTGKTLVLSNKKSAQILKVQLKNNYVWSDSQLPPHQIEPFICNFKCVLVTSC